MKFRVEQLRITFCSVTVLLLTIGTLTDRAATLTFPSASCGSGLQACINSASPGDTVEVATNFPISEDLTIDKSLTVRPALGFSPVLNDFASVGLSNPESNSNSIVFEGFTINPGFVQAVQLSSKPFNVQIRNLMFTDTFNDQSAIEVRTGLNGPYGAVNFDVSDNDITIPHATNNVQAVSVNGLNASTFNGTIRGNKILQSAGNEGGAIGVFNNTSQLAVDVIGNQVAGSRFNTGVSLFQFGPGSSDVRFINNLVDGQASVAGQPGAISVDVAAGDAKVLVANNTLVNSDIGISIDGREDLGATWQGAVANNVVANIAGSGVTIGDPLTTVSNDHNLVFNTGTNFFTAGPGTLFADPQFVGGGNFRLRFGSPGQDAGNNVHVPADVTLDLDGLARIRGARVDMGAYEIVPEPSSLIILLPAVLELTRRQRRDCRARSRRFAVLGLMT